MAVAETSTTRARKRLPPATGQDRPRRRRPGSVLAPMLVAGLLLALAVYTVLRDQAVSYRVAIAATELRPGTVVSANSFKWTDMRVAEEVVRGLVQADAASQFDGWVATDGVAAGQLVSRASLRPPSAPSRLRAMSLPIDAERAVAGDLARGDRVDVIAVVDGGASYVAAGLEVLAVASPRDGALGPTGRFAVTVAVDEQTALALARALESNTVSILRSTGSSEAAVGQGPPGPGRDQGQGRGLQPAGQRTAPGQSGS